MSIRALKIIFSSLLFVFCFLFFNPVRAAPPSDVIINEIAWMGTKVEGIESKNWWRYEWLELYNNTNQLISLDGWKIELYRTYLDWTLELNGNIPAQGYFLIVASDKILTNYDFDYSNLGGKLNNNGQKVVLKNAAGTIMDEIDCSTGWFEGDKKTWQTMERKNPQLPGSDSSNWQTSQNPGGTPKVKNSVFAETEIVEVKAQEPQTEPQTESEPQPKSEPKLLAQQEPSLSKASEDKPQPKPESIIYPSGVVINEILPSPKGPDDLEEWIELKNLNDKEVNLSQWKIRDTMGSITTYTLPDGTKIGPKGFLVLSRPITKITLNNSDDGLLLIQPNGDILDTVTYEKAARGQSYNLTESGWAWNATLTPGSANIVPSSTLETEATKSSKETAKESASSKESQETQTQRQLAAAGLQIPKSPKSLYIFLIALALAIFSGIIILILKRKIKV